MLESLASLDWRSCLKVLVGVWIELSTSGSGGKVLTTWSLGKMLGQNMGEWSIASTINLQTSLAPIGNLMAIASKIICSRAHPRAKSRSAWCFSQIVLVSCVGVQCHLRRASGWWCLLQFWRRGITSSALLLRTHADSLRGYLPHWRHRLGWDWALFTRSLGRQVRARFWCAVYEFRCCYGC